MALITGDAEHHLVPCAVFDVFTGEKERQERREVTNQQQQIERFVYTSRRCRLDKKIKEKGATQKEPN